MTHLIGGEKDFMEERFFGFCHSARNWNSCLVFNLQTRTVFKVAIHHSASMWPLSSMQMLLYYK